MVFIYFYYHFSLSFVMDKPLMERGINGDSPSQGKRSDHNTTYVSRQPSRGTNSIHSPSAETGRR